MLRRLAEGMAEQDLGGVDGGLRVITPKLSDQRSDRTWRISPTKFTKIERLGSLS